MSAGSLKLEVSNLTGGAVSWLRVTFTPQGAGGAAVEVNGGETGSTGLTMRGIECLGGPGTLYQVRVGAKNCRTYAFFQRMIAGKRNVPSDGRVLLVADVAKVKGIAAPAFGSLPEGVRRLLGTAAVYEALGPMEKACLLNIAAKARHGTADRALRHVSSLIRAEQDRCFCHVNPAMPAFLQRSPVFRTVDGGLHTPLPGFVREESYKSRDAHANLQVTLMRRPGTDEWAADIDIDEASGFEHGLEVIRNRITGGRTNPYQVRELLLLADWQERTLDPGYEFVF
jgi:hypothetical protein